jgi:hypothetical protein
MSSLCMTSMSSACMTSGSASLTAESTRWRPCAGMTPTAAPLVQRICALRRCRGGPVTKDDRAPRAGKIRAADQAQDSAGGEQRAAAPHGVVTGPATLLDARKPGETDQEQKRRDVEVQPQPEETMRGINAQELLPDPGQRVARDIQREQSRRSD